MSDVNLTGFSCSSVHEGLENDPNCQECVKKFKPVTQARNLVSEMSGHFNNFCNLSLFFSKKVRKTISQVWIKNLVRCCLKSQLGECKGVATSSCISVCVFFVGDSGSPLFTYDARYQPVCLYAVASNSPGRERCNETSYSNYIEVNKHLVFLRPAHGSEAHQLWQSVRQRLAPNSTG